MLQDDQPLAGHYGLCLSYLKKGLKNTNEVLAKQNDLSMFANHHREKIMTLNNFFKSKAASFSEKNTKVYKHKVFEENELPSVPEINKNILITPVEPPIFSKKLNEEALFASLKFFFF